MKLKYIFWCIALFVSTTACQKEEIMLFDREDAGIYFQDIILRSVSTGVETYVDSYTFPLHSYPLSTEVASSASIRIMGNVKDYPRPVKVVIDEENTTMIQGVHYDIDLSEPVIEPGKNTADITLRIIRNDDYVDNDFQVVLRLEGNEHFKVILEKQKASNVYTSTTGEISANTFTFIARELYTESTYWTLLGSSYFGTFSHRKFVFINRFMGWPHYDWTVFNTGAVTILSIGMAAPLVRAELQRLADAGTPMREDDGTLMQLGASFRVDYSAYE